MQMRVSTSVVCGLERMQMKVFMWEEEGGAMGHGIGEKCRKAERFAIECAHVALYCASEWCVCFHGVKSRNTESS